MAPHWLGNKIKPVIWLYDWVSLSRLYRALPPSQTLKLDLFFLCSLVFPPAMPSNVHELSHIPVYSHPIHPLVAPGSKVTCFH